MRIVLFQKIYHTIVLQDIDFTLKWTAAATQYAISPKAINVSTAAAMFKILVRKSPHKILLPTNFENCASRSDELCKTCEEKCIGSNYDRNDAGQTVESLTNQTSQLAFVDTQEVTQIPRVQTFRLLSQFVTVLKSQLKVAMRSLLQAAFDAPMHGVLYCMREVICDLELRLELCKR